MMARYVDTHPTYTMTAANHGWVVRLRCSCGAEFAGTDSMGRARAESIAQAQWHHHVATDPAHRPEVEE